MKIQNNRLGEIEFDENSVIEFPEGMLGLPEYKRYLMIQSPQMKPFLRLQCVEAPQIGFLTVDPAYADPDYKAYVVAQDPDHVFIDPEEEIVILVVCTLAPDSSDVTANLQAPVVINHKKMVGRQIVLIDSPFSLKHSLVSNARRREA